MKHTPPPKELPLFSARQVATLPVELPTHHNAPPGTSDVAAKRMRARAAPSVRVRILDLLARGPLYDEQGEQALGLKHQTYTAQRRALVLAGLVREVGRAKNARGLPVAVWGLA